MTHNDYSPESKLTSPVMQSEPFAVLVLEDDPGEALLVEQAFFAAGLRVPIQFAQDGPEIIRYLKGEAPFANREAHPHPALLLLKADQPRLDTSEVLSWLQENPERRPMLVTVVGAGPADADRAQALGADLFFPKPDDPGDLVEVADSLKRAWQGMACTAS